MSQKPGAFDASQGSPNLQANQFLQDNLSADAVRDVQAFTDEIVPLAGYILKTDVLDASAGVSIAAPFDLTLIDVVVRADATVSGGTVQVFNGATAVTNAITMATDKAVTRAGTIDDAQADFDEGDNITLTTHGATDAGLVSLIVAKREA
jgi:hypothetical protein